MDSHPIFNSTEIVLSRSSGDFQRINDFVQKESFYDVWLCLSCRLMIIYVLSLNDILVISKYMFPECQDD